MGFIKRLIHRKQTEKESAEEINRTLAIIHEVAAANRARMERGEPAPSEMSLPEKEDKDAEESLSPTITPAKTLPSGWNWTIFEDGSGHLGNTRSKHKISFDRGPLATFYIEFHIDSDNWDLFRGSFDAFKLFAEGLVKSKHLGLN